MLESTARNHDKTPGQELPGSLINLKLLTLKTILISCPLQYKSIIIDENSLNGMHRKARKSWFLGLFRGQAQYTPLFPVTGAASDFSSFSKIWKH